MRTAGSAAGGTGPAPGPATLGRTPKKASQVGPGRPVGHGGPARAGAARERLADAALEDPGADRVRGELAPEARVGAVREQRRALDLRPGAGQVERVELFAG